VRIPVEAVAGGRGDGQLGVEAIGLVDGAGLAVHQLGAVELGAVEPVAGGRGSTVRL
jgi:hypothetical protein